jgi:hypothetical protein
LTIYKDHKQKIDEYVASNKQILFIAHSQGNLFANIYYDYLKSKLSTDNFKVVHVAPASVVVNGPYTLADKDLIIGALAASGQIQGWNKAIPDYSARRPDTNGNTDYLGHGFLEIYFNKSLDVNNTFETFPKINSDILNSMSDLGKAACKYELSITAKSLNDPLATTPECYQTNTINAYTQKDGVPSRWSPVSCVGQLLIRPVNKLNNTYGFDSLNPPIVNKTDTFCNFTNQNVRYAVNGNVGTNTLRFGAAGAVGYSSFYPNGQSYKAPVQWGLGYESYVSGPLPYARPPGDLTLACQMSYQDVVGAPLKTILASISVPNVISTSQFINYTTSDFTWGGVGSWPVVTGNTCGPQDCAGLTP